MRGQPVDRQMLAAMVGALQHRGPDDTSLHVEREAGLAHARLSIIDVEGGGQPMCTADGRYWITFNGEIYNYLELREELLSRGFEFRTRSDTEVLLNLYRADGEQCVNRLNGQWAFGIWDTERKRLFLCRDRLGVRPLFYTQTPGTFLFSSEIKALRTCADISCELDLQALDQIFTFWVTVPPRTAFAGIDQLPPGHSLMLENGRAHIRRYWHIDYTGDSDDGGDRTSALAEELLCLLLDSVRIRLRSDVPVGAYLSGGLDSTFIAALARSFAGDRLRTFSVGFDDSDFDETVFQTNASAFLGTSHTTVRCSSAAIGQMFPAVVRHTEQPILRSAPAPLFLLSKLVHDSGYKVVLTGEGSDETMGGYDIFKEAKIRRFLSRQPQSSMRPLLLKRLYPYMDGIQRQPSTYLRRFFHASSRACDDPYFSHTPRWELTSGIKRFFTEDVRAQVAARSPFDALRDTVPPEFSRWDPFNRAEYLELAYLLPGFILSSQGDRMAMAHSVEGRYPFLDHRVVEFAAKLPPRLKLRVLDEKYLLKRIAAGRIPECVRTRHKQPYRAPGGKCFFDTRGSYVQDLLSCDRLKRHGIFKPEPVSALIAKFRNGRGCSEKDNMALLGILSTELLLDAFSR